MKKAETVQWNVTVSASMDESVRKFLAERGGYHEDGLSYVVEKALKSYLYEHNREWLHSMETRDPLDAHLLGCLMSK